MRPSTAPGLKIWRLASTLDGLIGSAWCRHLVGGQGQWRFAQLPSRCDPPVAVRQLGAVPDEPV